MIEVENLAKSYGAFTAIQGVTFSTKPGEIVGFLGVNGAGKTTTMRILTGYMPPTAGTARIAGYDVFKQSRDARMRTGYLPETVPLYTEMMVYDYLDYIARLRGMRLKREKRILHVLDMVNIGPLANRIIGTLSKGQRQRVGLAQAIVHNPDVLILDEPTIGLDPRQIREVRAVIRQLGEAHTILLSTHILPEVEQTCDRVLIINRGRVRADLPIQEATRGGKSERVLVRAEGAAPQEIAHVLSKVVQVGSVNVMPDGGLEVLRTEAAEAASEDVRPLLAHAIVTHGWRLLELRVAGSALEDLFLRVTREDVEGIADQAMNAGADDEEPEDDADEGDDDDEDED